MKVRIKDFLDLIKNIIDEDDDDYDGKADPDYPWEVPVVDLTLEDEVDNEIGNNTKKTEQPAGVTEQKEGWNWGKQEDLIWLKNKNNKTDSAHIETNSPQEGNSWQKSGG